MPPACKVPAQERVQHPILEAPSWFYVRRLKGGRGFAGRGSSHRSYFGGFASRVSAGWGETGAAGSFPPAALPSHCRLGPETVPADIPPVEVGEETPRRPRTAKVGAHLTAPVRGTRVLEERAVVEAGSKSSPAAGNWLEVQNFVLLGLEETIEQVWT